MRVSAPVCQTLTNDMRHSRMSGFRLTERQPVRSPGMQTMSIGVMIIRR